MVQTADMNGCLELGGRRGPSFLRSPCEGLEPLEIGIYWVRVANGAFSKSKKLIIH
jgi:hypothetical protein